MSSPVSSASRARPPAWLWEVLGAAPAPEGARLTLGGQHFEIRGGIPRSRAALDSSESQTGETFAYKWRQRETFESPAALARVRAWLTERYGAVADSDWLREHGEHPLLLDAGCGAAMSALELFGAVLPRMRYLGVDLSGAVDVARDRFDERGLAAAFLQADLCNLPLPERSVDLIFSEGVLHHTGSTQAALKALAKLLKPGGRFLFYVYRRKGPVREFTDDLVREKLRHLPPEAAWKAMESLTRLGIVLGELDAEITVPEPVEVLGIPAGRINVQRLFYWHVAKAFYHPDLTFDELNHINFDWYAPAHAQRQSPEEVRGWCDECGLAVEREILEEAGITVVARRAP
jgi:arsenite methyltransferase